MCLEDGNMLSGLLVTDQPGVVALDYIAARHSGDDVQNSWYVGRSRLFRRGLEDGELTLPQLLHEKKCFCKAVFPLRSSNANEKLPV